MEYNTKYYEFLNMTNLRTLSIQSDEDFSIMKGFVNMHKLKTLCINAAASTSRPRHFNYISKLTALTHLTLEYCKIPEESFLNLTALTNLKELVLIRSSFVNESGNWEIAKRIRELTSLRDLEVLQMEDVSVGDTDFIEFKKLTQLTMAEMPLSFELPPNLKSLEVGVLDATIDKYVDKLINLESLAVRLKNDETNKTFENISKLQQLTRLRIMGPFKNKNAKGLNALTLLPPLKVLSFWMTNKKALSAKMILKIISNIPSLTKFYCDNEKYLDSIREQVPYLLC